MVSFSTLLLTARTAVGVLAAPSSEIPTKRDAALVTDLTTRQSVQPGEGTNNGYFYSFYNSGGGNVTFTLGSGGSYSTSWTDDGDFVGGTGWNPGSAQYVTISP